jgi:hypothetical protein
MRLIILVVIAVVIVILISYNNSKTKNNISPMSEKAKEKMSQEIKDEALEQVEKDVQFGFESKEEMLESIAEMFYNVDNFDEKWLKNIIAEKFEQHIEESKSWSKPTDFDRLAKAFDELIQQKIVCLHKAGYTKQDGIDDCGEVTKEIENIGIKPIGFCFYHTQDLERAIDPKVKNILLGFGCLKQDDKKALLIGHKIANILRQNNFDVKWNETIDQRIEIININWKKLPDDIDWGLQRNVEIMTQHK